jgi:putative membrane protein
MRSDKRRGWLLQWRCVPQGGKVSVFQRFHVTTADLLGSGGESQVYALDRERVLRIYKPDMPQRYVERRHQFYALLQERQPPFEVPAIYEVGTVDDQTYTIERRMRGRDFGSVLPTLTGADRRRALASYLHVAEEIGKLHFPERPFGEILTFVAPIQRATWPAFLWDRMQQTLRESRADLEADVPALDAVLADTQQALQQFAGFDTRSLVHGDYFPANVFIDEQLTICGVGDFGYTSVIGDGRLDLTGAVAYLELIDSYTPADTAFLEHRLMAQHGPAIRDVMAIYRLYYSVYFSYCKTGDPTTYAWCVRNLQAQAARHAV